MTSARNSLSLLKYGSYKIKRIINNCFLSFKNTKNLVIFRNWLEKTVKKPEAVIQRCSEKKRCFWKFRLPKLFFCEICEIFKYIFFHGTPLVVASEKLKAEAVIRRCSVKKLLLQILQTKAVFPWILWNFQKQLFFLERPLWLLLKS